MLEPKTVDALYADGKPIYGTAAFRVQEQIDAQPIDQESTEFYAGDIRDISALCDPTNKTVKSLRDKTKGVAPGTLLNLSIADVKLTTSLAKDPLPIQEPDASSK